MKIPRVYYKDLTNANNKAYLDADTSHYLLQVLRLKEKDFVCLFDGVGNAVNATIANIKKKLVTLEIIEQIDFINNSSAPKIPIHLGQAIGKGTKMDLIIQKTTELGITAITPILSSRTVVKIKDQAICHKQEHWQKIAIAACCQCQRNTLPIINSPLSISNWIAQCKGLNIILDPNATCSLTKLMSINNNPINILIGPEGGLTSAEIKLAKESNFSAIKFGPRILRTETAAIAIVAAVQTIFGDLGE